MPLITDASPPVSFGDTPRNFGDPLGNFMNPPLTPKDLSLLAIANQKTKAERKKERKLADAESEREQAQIDQLKAKNDERESENKIFSALTGKNATEDSTISVKFPVGSEAQRPVKQTHKDEDRPTFDKAMGAFADPETQTDKLTVPGGAAEIDQIIKTVDPAGLSSKIPGESLVETAIEKDRKIVTEIERRFKEKQKSTEEKMKETTDMLDEQEKNITKENPGAFNPELNEVGVYKKGIPIKNISSAKARNPQVLQALKENGFEIGPIHKGFRDHRQLDDPTKTAREAQQAVDDISVGTAPGLVPVDTPIADELGDEVKSVDEVAWDEPVWKKVSTTAAAPQLGTVSERHKQPIREAKKLGYTSDDPQTILESLRKDITGEGLTKDRALDLLDRLRAVKSPKAYRPMPFEGRINYNALARIFDFSGKQPGTSPFDRAGIDLNAEMARSAEERRKAHNYLASKADRERAAILAEYKALKEGRKSAAEGKKAAAEAYVAVRGSDLTGRIAPTKALDALQSNLQQELTQSGLTETQSREITANLANEINKAKAEAAQKKLESKLGREAKTEELVGQAKIDAEKASIQNLLDTSKDFRNANYDTRKEIIKNHVDKANDLLIDQIKRGEEKVYGDQSERLKSIQRRMEKFEELSFTQQNDLLNESRKFIQDLFAGQVERQEGHKYARNLEEYKHMLGESSKISEAVRDQNVENQKAFNQYELDLNKGLVTAENKAEIDRMLKTDQSYLNIFENKRKLNIQADDKELQDWYNHRYRMQEKLLEMSLKAKLKKGELTKADVKTIDDYREYTKDARGAASNTMITSVNAMEENRKFFNLYTEIGKNIPLNLREAMVDKAKDLAGADPTGDFMATVKSAKMLASWYGNEFIAMIQNSKDMPPAARTTLVKRIREYSAVMKGSLAQMRSWAETKGRMSKDDEARNARSLIDLAGVPIETNAKMFDSIWRAKDNIGRAYDLIRQDLDVQGSEAVKTFFKNSSTTNTLAMSKDLHRFFGVFKDYADKAGSYDPADRPERDPASERGMGYKAISHAARGWKDLVDEAGGDPSKIPAERLVRFMKIAKKIGAF